MSIILFDYFAFVRKFLSIPLIILLLFSGITVNLASHFCNGAFIGNKISFSGELADCGMEHHENTHNRGINPDHTCADFTASYTISSNYVPSQPASGDSGLQVIQPLLLPAGLATGNMPAETALITETGPPGSFNPSKVDREVICIFRI